VELTIGAQRAVMLWEKLLEVGAPGVRPAGLGARDTLRLEAGLPLYGHELTEAIDPFQAGLEFAVDLQGRTFPGSQALASQVAAPREWVRVGLVLDGRRAARQDYPIVHEETVVGTITSGTFSPTLDRPIAMGYVLSSLARPGTELAIEIRGQMHPARVTPLPFYRRGNS
jgi:aminomethyltransferase